MGLKVDFFSKTVEELRDFFLEYGEPPFRGDQIFKWINKEGISDYFSMTDIPKSLRQKLSDEIPLPPPLKLSKFEISQDKSVKFAFTTNDMMAVESVLIPGSGRDRRKYTLCVSTQSGCAMGCKFCETATMGLLKNLTPGEITWQVTAALNYLMENDKDSSDYPREQRITNIVYMGMGEPFHNLDSVVKSIMILSSSKGLDFSQRRITVSTSGLVDKFKEFAAFEDLKVNLAVSINATTDVLRDQMMPINKKWPLRVLFDAIVDYPLPKRQRITLEYIMFKNLNDSDADARRLIKLIKRIRVKVNLIPYNTGSLDKYINNIKLESSSKKKIDKFAEILRNSKIAVTIRNSYGQDIKAACGQLAREEN